MKFTIVIPVKELNSYIKESIPHILRLNYPKEKYEILILPNSQPKRIPEYLKDKRIRIIPTGKVSPAVKRDIGSHKAKGEILAFLDDDSFPRDDWLIAAERTFNNLPDNFAAINGPAITPKNPTAMEMASGVFFESRFGGGATHRCRDIGKSFEIDDAPSVNFLVKRKEFLEVGGFGSEYWPGEDSIFCQKLKDDCYRLWYQHNLIVFHHRRKTIKSHLKQVAGYGKHRGNFFRRGIGCSRKLNYLVPSLFLIVNLYLFLFNVSLWIIFLLIYIVLILFNLCSCRKLPIYLIFPTAALTFVSHLTYGSYFIKGFFTKDIRSLLR